jgi:hypothetical protein
VNVVAQRRLGLIDPRAEKLAGQLSSTMAN